MQKSNNIFDARKIEKGDIISGLKVEFIEVYPSDNLQSPESYMTIVKFSGKKELSGTLYHYSDQPLLGRSILFEISDSSLARLPGLDKDTASDWFMIENYDDAVKFLEPADSQKEASIIIDRYTINYSFEVVHTADPVEIIE